MKRRNAVPAEEYVTSLYYTLLKRAPDPEGLAAHVNFLRRGGDASKVYEGFIKSDEYQRVKQKNAQVTQQVALQPYAEIDAKGFGLDMVLEASRRHFSDRAYIQGLENLPSLVGRKMRAVKTIALYYHKMRSGGIERVTAWQATAWTELGYRVVLITDEPPHPDDYVYDERVERVTIPPKFMWADHGEYVERGSALASVLRNVDADVFVTNLGHEICTVWDILVAKSLDIPVILGWHNVFDADYHDGQGLDAAQIRLLGHRYADLTTVLTSMDRTWFTLNGYAARVVPNPPTFATLPSTTAPLTGKTIVWIARVERHQKRVDHAIQMMAVVLAEHPDAELLIVGTGPELSWARELARSLAISSRVRFTGYTDDVGAYLRNASLQVMTSEFEGYGLVIEEAWSHGVPSVMYAMPYLELVKSGKGYVAVPQGDVKALARTVSDLLADRERLIRLGKEARSVAESFRQQSAAEIWRGVFDDLAVAERMGPTAEQLQISPDMQEIVRHLSEKLFPSVKTPLGLPVPKEETDPQLKRIQNIARKFDGLRGLFPGRRFKPLRMIDCTSIPLGDSFMFFSGLYAMLDNGLAVCAPDCVLHTHEPMANICRVLFSQFGLRIESGPPAKLLHPFYYPHPPVTNDDFRRTYLGSDWRMDWVESTDRQKTIGRPGYRDTLRKMTQLFVSERMVYGRGGGWKTATPSYIGFRVWWPIALKLGVYPVVFYSMVSRSLGNMRETLHRYIDEQIALDEKAGRKVFRGNAAFPSGNSYQTIDPETYKYVMGGVPEDSFTCFVQNDSPWHDDFALAGIKTRHISSIEDTLKIIRSARNVVTCCSFTSHVAQFLRDDFLLVMFKDLPENNVNPGANPKILTYNPPCSPCNYLPRGQFKTCPAGFPHCIALENSQFRDKIKREIGAILARDAAAVH
jgi:glycosyltransferase involved in cell wall biosynthesis